MKIKICIVFVIATAVVAVFGYNMFFSQRSRGLGKVILERCADTQEKKLVECISKETLASVMQDPQNTGELFDDIWDLLQTGKLEADPRYFSPLAHDAGMAMVQIHIPIEKILSYCGESFYQGCMHGAVMESGDTIFAASSTPHEFVVFCERFKSDQTQYRNCLHGIGHEIVGKVQQPLNEILGYCGALDDYSRSACVSGIFMEYSKGEVDASAHSHKKVYTRALPCDSVEEAYKSICYASAGAYRQYEVDSEPFEDSYQFCQSVPEQYRNSCMMNLSDRITFIHGGDVEKAKRVCEEFFGGVHYTCLESFKSLTQ